MIKNVAYCIEFVRQYLSCLQSKIQQIHCRAKAAQQDACLTWAQRLLHTIHSMFLQIVWYITDTKHALDVNTTTSMTWKKTIQGLGQHADACKTNMPSN